MEQIEMQTEKIISRKQFRELVHISRTTEYRLSLKQKLPPRVIVDGFVLGYRESDYHAWLDTFRQLKGEKK